MSKILVTRGLPASGKSTFAQAWVAEDPDNRMQVSRDDLRHAFYKTYGKLSRPQENMITVAETGVIEAALERDKAVVVDAMHLRPRYVRRWEKLARQKGVEFEVEEFEISIEESISRNWGRVLRDERNVPKPVIEGMRKYLAEDGKLMPYEPLPEDAGAEVEPYVADEMNPAALIVDLDGTLALHTSGRSPYDLSRVGEDSACEQVAEMVHAVHMEYDVKIIYLSGREETARKDTVAWIGRNVGYDQDTYELHMRKAGDGRKDTIVKRELFDEHVRHNYNVRAVIDDRPSVCRMWRELGLFTFQVGDPHVEF